jgi:hypothetical protein
MDVCVFILCLCCPVCRWWPCNGLITRPRSSTVCVNKITKLKKKPGPNKGLYSHWCMNKWMKEWMYEYRKYDCKESRISSVWSEVSTAEVMKSTIFWDITLCTPLKVNRRLGGKYHLDLQGLISRGRYKCESRWQAHAGISLDLFNPEDGGDMFLRKVGWLSASYTVL